MKQARVELDARIVRVAEMKVFIGKLEKQLGQSLLQSVSGSPSN